ncbi:hypothetical protein Tdes44962_MAKER05052 [Teratosphaeria destructans]|uniref:Uncharacterized protein n=1 Tax=Teratosphaeria destructans TaxID=418781 RepID=A0A9W7SL15_9PEZI|nr:hypothetical protein Tdes44962_MAKER05052 [Teratosphaeria destructans]
MSGEQRERQQISPRGKRQFAHEEAERKGSVEMEMETSNFLARTKGLEVRSSISRHGQARLAISTAGSRGSEGAKAAKERRSQLRGRREDQRDQGKQVVYA